MVEKDKVGAKTSWTGGMIMVYGAAVGNALNALAKGQAPTDDLLLLRDQAKAIVDAQGDLVAALKALDAEITKRGTGGKALAAPAAERFVAQIDGLALSDKMKADIEQAIQKAVMAEVAQLDTKGDLVSTPLSKSAQFGLGEGSRTAGLYLVAQNLNTP
ncbi:MAG: hypothetical protein WA418_10405 [Bradyrhizobium sp.]